MRNYVGSVFFIPSDDPDRKNRILDLMARTPQHVMVAAYRGLADYAPEKLQNRVTVPSLYIVADEPSARTDMARLKELIPDLNLARTAGSGHFCQLEVPDQINAMIARFITVALARI
jgi:pimeloyl-ACP methyl ester carboxylesterase